MRALTMILIIQLIFVLVFVMVVDISGTRELSTRGSRDTVRSIRVTGEDAHIDRNPRSLVAPPHDQF